jgi:hypothetical protein
LQQGRNTLGMKEMFREISPLNRLFDFYRDTERVKKALPSILILLLFQDLIAVNAALIHPSSGKIVNNIDELLILLGLPLIFLYYYERKWKIDFLLFSLLLIFILGSISSLINQVPFRIAVQGAILMFKGFLVLFIFRGIHFSAKDIQKMAKRMKRLVAIVLLFALIDYFFYEYFRALLNTDHKFDYRMGLISIQSVFIHPGIYGWFMALVGMYYLAIYVVKQQRSSGYLAAAAFIGSFLSFRFKTVLAILFNTLFSVIHKRSNFKKWINLRDKKGFVLYIAFVTILLLVVLYGVTQLSFLTIDRYITIDYTKSARKALYLFGFVIAWSEFPFGVGFGRYGSWTAREYYSPIYMEYGMDKIYGLYSMDPKWATDTYWPSVMGEVGIIGTLVLLAIFIYMITIIYKGYRFVQGTEYKIFLLFTIMVINQSLIESLGEQVYNSGPQYFFIFAFMGISLSIIKANKISLDTKQAQKNINNLKLFLRFAKDEKRI